METIALLEPYLRAGFILGALGIAAWVLTTWLRIKHGYPLENGWGQAVYPKTTNETTERMKLLTTENAQLRAELGSIKDRLAAVERIVTDRSFTLEHEIEQLRNTAN
jgi:hypothetical protein